MDTYINDYYDEQVFSGIEIGYAIVSPSTHEIFFVDVHNRKVRDVDEHASESSLEFIESQDMYIIEQLLELPHEIAIDSYGNLFYKISLDNGIVLSSRFFRTYGEVIAVDNISDGLIEININNNQLFSLSIIILIAALIIAITSFAMNRRIFHKNYK